MLHYLQSYMLHVHYWLCTGSISPGWKVARIANNLDFEGEKNKTEIWKPCLGCNSNSKWSWSYMLCLASCRFIDFIVAVHLLFFFIPVTVTAVIAWQSAFIHVWYLQQVPPTHCWSSMVFSDSLTQWASDEYTCNREYFGRLCLWA